MTLLFVFLTIFYLYLLLRVWNIGVPIAAAMMMLARVPNLLWEIPMGQKITRSSGPRGAVSILSTLITWSALPVLWLALCWKAG